MDSSDARDHLGMLHGIVRAADRSVHISPALLVTIGLVCAAVTGVEQIRLFGLRVPLDPWIQPALVLVVLAAIAITAWRGRHAGYETFVDHYAGVVFLVVFAVAMTLNLTAQHRVVSAAGMGLFWAAGFSGALLIVGAIGNSRPLLVGGVAMLAATAAASLAPGWLPGLLAAGWLMGFVVPGGVLAWSGSRGRSAAV